MNLEEAIELARNLNKKQRMQFIGIAVEEDGDIFGWFKKPRLASSSWGGWYRTGHDLWVSYLGTYSGSIYWKKTWREL